MNDIEIQQGQQSIIKQLDDSTIRRISSGQVIVSMAAAVKELIENALDAGASSITIRFDDFGKELIEVIDNGFGIEKNNFQLLGQRNCTSKLMIFDHLNVVQTFGFRGEALNSLCNLANVKIHTRHSSQAMGTILFFDTNGQIIKQESKPREIGTTVSLSQLFCPIPVRRKEFLTNFRRSFDKTLSLIYQYCLGMIGFKITCSHLKNGTYSTIFINNGISIQSNIIDIFDYKQFSQLRPFICYKDIDSASFNDSDFEINGFISKSDAGCGRSLSDRQYFYINGRPCDLPMISKKINQIYRTYNRNQYPFILLRITISEKLVDRNFTPDKRKVMITDNHCLLKVIQHSLEKMFTPEDKELLSLSQSSINCFLKRTLEEKEDDVQNKIIKYSSSMNLSFEDPAPKNSNDNIAKSKIIFEEENQKSTKATEFLHPFFQTFENNNNVDISNINSKEPDHQETRIDKNLDLINTKMEQNEKYSKIQNEDENLNITISDEDIRVSRENRVIKISIDEICRQYKNISVHQPKIPENIMNFKAQIKPEDNEQALNELKRVISKQSFAKMRVIGQFNLGFIIAQLNRDLFIIDQHAIDERYNFEKFLNDPQLTYQNLVCPLNLKLSSINEMIVIENLDIFKKFGFDILIDSNANVGQRIKLTRIPLGKEWIGGKEDIEELINAIRESPLSIGENFIFTGLKQEIASKGCRSSIMIGENLNKTQMENLLSKIINVRDPWHCAHNRPTIRHLISLDYYEEI